MSPWHLLWLLPLTFAAGFMLCAVFAAGSESKHVSNLTRELNAMKEQRDRLLVNWDAELSTYGAEVTD